FTPSTSHKRKGFLPLLTAFKQLPEDDYELLVAGDKLPVSNVPNNVRCLGFVSDMAELYASVDITVLPSYYEPFGLVVPESLACGTPVIISEHVGAKDLINDNYGIVIPSVTVNAIKQAIEQARQQQFTIPEDFAQQHQLTLPAHIQQLKTVMSQL
ncbi:unnamed protein product, partial [marine sediment metagenome]